MQLKLPAFIACHPAQHLDNYKGTWSSILTDAKNDLTAAFTDVAGRTPVTTAPTELGGTTRMAGVYSSGSTTFEITAGDGPLVLDAQGDASAIFIFEMAADGTGLTVGPGSEVSLINDAQACNVFWRVDTATIDTSATFKGTILALNSITVANGANIEGRLLARNGNVTLINDTITVPTCETPTVPPDTGGGETPGDGTPTGGAGSGSGGAGSSTPSLPNTGVNITHISNQSWDFIIPLGVFAALFWFYRTVKSTPCSKKCSRYPPIKVFKAVGSPL